MAVCLFEKYHILEAINDMEMQRTRYWLHRLGDQQSFSKDARRIKHTCVRQRGAFDWSKIAMRHTAAHRYIYMNFDPAQNSLVFLVSVQMICLTNTLHARAAAKVVGSSVLWVT